MGPNCLWYPTSTPRPASLQTDTCVLPIRVPPFWVATLSFPLSSIPPQHDTLSQGQRRGHRFARRGDAQVLCQEWLRRRRPQEDQEGWWWSRQLGQLRRRHCQRELYLCQPTPPLQQLLHVPPRQRLQDKVRGPRARARL